MKAAETAAAATAVCHSGHADRARRSEGRDSSSPRCKHDGRPLRGAVSGIDGAACVPRVCGMCASGVGRA